MQFLQYLLTNREVLLQSFLEGNIEPLIEILERIENLRHQKMQQRPQLRKIILKWGSSKQQPTMSLKIQKNLPSLRFEILNILSLIQYHIVPSLPPKNGMISDCNFIACYTDMETVEL